MSWAEINGRPRMISAYNESKVNLTLPDPAEREVAPNEINQFYWVLTGKRLTIADFKKLLVRISGKTRIVFTDEKDGSVSFSKDYRNLALRALTAVYPEVNHLATPPPGVSKCDTRCRNAEGLECRCKGCDGQMHRKDISKDWKHVGETTLIKVGPVKQHEETLVGTQEPDEPLSQEGWDALVYLYDRYHELGLQIFAYRPEDRQDTSALYTARSQQEKANRAKFEKAFLNSKPVGETETMLPGE